MATVPEEVVREVRERLSIQEIVGEYVSLRKSGSNFQGLCPFHGEKTPSFNVNPARGIFHCFGCGVGGDAFAFVMRMEGISFPEALRLLAKRVGVTIEDRPMTPTERRRRDEREELLQVAEAAAAFYRGVLTGSAEASACRRYLEERGVSAATAEAYGLGFAAERGDPLRRFLDSRRVAPERAESLGLVRRSERGVHDLFRGRLLFPIRDPFGRTIAMAGRVLDSSLPKYINSPESPLYRKSEVLFGLDLARQAIREKGFAILVEGYFDHLALYQAGFRNAVATCGTALTEGHVRLLRRYAPRVALLFDGDSAGAKAAVRAGDLCLDEGFPATVVELPPGEDPDTFIANNGAEAFSRALEHGRPFIDHLIRRTFAVSGTVEARAKAANELLPRLGKLQDAIEREKYLQELSRVVEVSPALLRREAAKKGEAPSVPSPQAPRAGAGRDAEDVLLCLMGKYPKVAARAAETGIADLFRPELVPLAEAIAARMASAGEVEWPALLEVVEPPEERTRLGALFIDESPFDDLDAEKAFEQCMQARERVRLKEMTGLRRELVTLDPDNPRYWDVMQRLNSLRTRKSRLS